MEVLVRPDGHARYIITCPTQMEWNARIDLVDALAREVRDELLAVIVDLQDVTYINSAGLGALFALRKYVHGRGGRMVVARPNVTIERLLKTVNLPALVPVVATLDDARTQLETAA